VLTPVHYSWVRVTSYLCVCLCLRAEPLLHTDWPAPRNLKDVGGFLGFANFYRRFIKGFARVARPLNDLTKKDAPWSWGPSQQEAFAELKAQFTSSPVLVMWQPDLETRMEVDASAFATGGVISQKQVSDGLHHPIAFRSESLSEPERNYEIYDRELLAIVQGLEDWRHYLIGLPEPFTIAVAKAPLRDTIKHKI
jgi:hypothetical protein